MSCLKSDSQSFKHRYKGAYTTQDMLDLEQPLRRDALRVPLHSPAHRGFTDDARRANRELEKCIAIMEHTKRANPRAIFCLENPQRPSPRAVTKPKSPQVARGARCDGRASCRRTTPRIPVKLGAWCTSARAGTSEEVSSCIVKLHNVILGGLGSVLAQ